MDFASSSLTESFRSPPYRGRKDPEEVEDSARPTPESRRNVVRLAGVGMPAHVSIPTHPEERVQPR